MESIGVLVTEGLVVGFIVFIIVWVVKDDVGWSALVVVVDCSKVFIALWVIIGVVDSKKYIFLRLMINTFT